MPWKECVIVEQRMEFVRRSYEPGVVFKSLCQEYGISPKTGYKWLNRFELEGNPGLSDRSRRPRRHSHQLSEPEVCEMVKFKLAHPSWGPRKIREVYRRSHGVAPSESSFKRVLARAGLTQKRRKRFVRCVDGPRPCISIQEPNDVWTVDFKGWWLTDTRQRCEPLTVRDERSRYLLTIKAMRTSRTAPVRSVFEELFAEYGLPRWIRSDNGSPFACIHSPPRLSPLSVWWISLGIGVDRIDPGCPTQNGGHERMHLDIRRELQGMIEGDLDDHQSAFDAWRQEFNWERPHDSLGMRVPGEAYSKSTREYKGTPEDLFYPIDMLRRRVSLAGKLCINNQEYFLSRSLRGVDLGLRPSPQRRYQAWLGDFVLGVIDETTVSMDWAVPPSP